MISVHMTTHAMRVLDFDIECRPLGWYGGGDFVHKEVTAIAAKFIGEKTMHLWMLGRDEPEVMLEGIVKLYNAADMVTGHFIRGYDLPTLNSALFEFNMPALQDKLTQDTKLDLVKRSGISTSMENLSAMLGLRRTKVQMDQSKWRAANRLTTEGLRYVQERVTGDVEEHIELRAELLKRNMLRPPVIWESQSNGEGNYHA